MCEESVLGIYEIFNKYQSLSFYSPTQCHFWRRRTFLWVLFGLWYWSVVPSVDFHLGFSHSHWVCISTMRLFQTSRKKWKPVLSSMDYRCKIQRTDGLWFIIITKRFTESIKILTLCSITRNSNLNQSVNFPFILFYFVCPFYVCAEAIMPGDGCVMVPCC